jgi:formate hydrogenlyase subunit 3/multisubunit Na+/H+ antiporter MnhD subunit
MWFFFNLLVVSMVLVVVARNGILFIAAWEVMAIASFFLVTFEHEKAEVRSAGLTYLVATHLGTAFLLAMFAILGRETGSLDFDSFSQVGALAPAAASVVFILAMIGFGAKAGFVPMHVWLPEAHPAAPSHVSALMSGVMIKTGIYGILRVLTFLDTPLAWWGILLIGIGLTSGVLGVLFALAQHDLKRLLAYHSVENIGIIALGMGTGVLALSQGMSAVAVLGFAGAILHVLNHAAFKGLLFLGAGSVLHATGHRDMDRQGGLLKRLPITGSTFLIGAAAISGLPPLNGFVSEFLIFLGALNGVTGLDMVTSASLVAVIGGLGLIGGLAIACFTKAFGVVFLGEPRTEQAASAHEGGLGFRIPMLVLASACVLIGVLPFLSVQLVLPVAAQLSGVPLETAGSQLAISSSPLTSVAIAALIVIGLSAILVLLRQGLLARREIGSTVTWDCGYERPSARMQYTSSSFAQPLVQRFRQLLGTRVRLHAIEGYFPGRASFHSDTPDVFTDRMYQPAVMWIEWVSSRLRWLQHGRVQIYLLYIFVALEVLMIWKLGF